jgi:hypothetical protein
MKVTKSSQTIAKPVLAAVSIIHPRFLGCPQYKTLKVVNEKVFTCN